MCVNEEISGHGFRLRITKDGQEKIIDAGAEHYDDHTLMTAKCPGGIQH